MGRRAKRGGVGFPKCGNTVSRDQPPPLRGTSFQRKEGEKRRCVYRHRHSCGEADAFSAISAAPNPPLPFLFQRKAERFTAHVGKRESLTANDKVLISVSLKIIRAPSSGRGRRAKRGGVGFPECGSTVSRDQPPPLRGTSFQRKEEEKRR